MTVIAISGCALPALMMGQQRGPKRLRRTGAAARLVELPLDRCAMSP
jgi:hypothetical protein